MIAPLPDPPSPSALLAALREGLEAYDQLLRLYHPYLLRIAREDISCDLNVLLGASGVVQVTFWKFWQAIRDFRGHTEAELRAWLRSTLHSILRDEERKLHTASRDVSRQECLPGNRSSAAWSGPCADPAPSPGSQVVQREQLERLEQALKRLPADQRLAVLLQKEHELRDDQIGRLLNCSPEAVRMKRVRALARLRHELGEDHAH
jgi:RNA polymerase sigma-70 factor (ECF subfamily)